MGSGFKDLIATDPARNAAGITRASVGLLFLLVCAGVPAEVFGADSSAPGAGSRPARVADCTDHTVVHGPVPGLEPLWWMPAAVASPLHESALQIERDPETGGWGLASLHRADLPSFAEAAAVSRAADDLVAEVLPGGAVLLNLRGRFQTLSLASRTARGDVHFGCAEDALSLFEWLRHDTPAVNSAGWPEE